MTLSWLTLGTLVTLAAGLVVVAPVVAVALTVALPGARRRPPPCTGAAMRRCLRSLTPGCIAHCCKAAILSLKRAIATSGAALAGPPCTRPPFVTGEGGAKKSSRSAFGLPDVLPTQTNPTWGCHGR